MSINNLDNNKIQLDIYTPRFPLSNQENISGYILPLFSTKAPYIQDQNVIKPEILAALYGLHYNCNKITLKIEQQHNISEKVCLWIEQPSDIAHLHFQQMIEKICQYYSLDTRCYIQMEKGKVVIDLYQSNDHRNLLVEKENAMSEFTSELWGMLLPESAKILDVEVNDAFDNPQTNFGRLARDLKVKEVLGQLNIKP